MSHPLPLITPFPCFQYPQSKAEVMSLGVSISWFKVQAIAHSCYSLGMCCPKGIITLCPEPWACASPVPEHVGSRLEYLLHWLRPSMFEVSKPGTSAGPCPQQGLSKHLLCQYFSIPFPKPPVSAVPHGRYLLSQGPLCPWPSAALVLRDAPGLSKWGL